MFTFKQSRKKRPCKTEAELSVYIAEGQRSAPYLPGGPGLESADAPSRRSFDVPPLHLPPALLLIKAVKLGERRKCKQTLHIKHPKRSGTPVQ